MRFLYFSRDKILCIVSRRLKLSLWHNLVFGKRGSFSSSTYSFILIVSNVARSTLKVATSFQFAYRPKLSGLFARSTNIILMIVSVSIELSLRNNHILRQLYFFCPLPLPSIQVIIKIAWMSWEGIFTELDLSLWNKFICWPSCTFFDILFSIYWLACKFIFGHDKVFLNHFILSFRMVVIIFRIILIIWAMEITMLNWLWAFMLSYVKTIIPQLHV